MKETRQLSRTAATLIGFSAILMWAFLALITSATGRVPAFQLAAITFLIGGALGVIRCIAQPKILHRLKEQPLQLWLAGILSLFAYHAFYFAAIKTAPAVEVSLIAYLWPLFMVIFSAFLPGESLRAHHVAGLVLGLIGASLVITRGEGFALSNGIQLGHLLAVPCALIWSGYSVLARRWKSAPTDIVTVFCLGSAVLALIAHFLFEEAHWPQDMVQWLAVAALGLFPVGAAFYVWDYGIKRGDIMVLGALSYLSPLLSTIILLLFGFAAYHWSIAIACLLITAGAIIAAKDLLIKRTV